MRAIEAAPPHGATTLGESAGAAVGSAPAARPGRHRAGGLPLQLGALVMATNMTIGMSLWMRYRRHGWRSIAEMGASMYIPFIVLFVPMWMGLISGHTMMVAGHVLMPPCMAGVMLLRPDEYTRHHH